VIIEPLLSSLTYASWADSGKIVRNSSDTCVVIVNKNGLTFQYTIDMMAGLVVATRDSSPGLSSPPSQLILWSEDRGIFYFRRICAGNATLDTGSIYSGGYDFSDILLNGQQVTGIFGDASPRKAAAGFRLVRDGERKTKLSGIPESMPVSLFDVRGRRLFSGYSDRNGFFDIASACSPGGCPSGPIVVLLKGRDGKSVFSTTIAR
jgi:hypothetical protein